MSEKLYYPLPDPAAYLARLGLNPEDCRRSLHPELPESPSDYSIPHTKESLDTLVHAHLFNIPFEDLDIFDLRQEVPLGIPALFDKMVTRKRGGYCFELNGLFYSLLESLGFSCHALAQRVLREGKFPPLCHRITVVTLPDTGERITCDVGFGGPAPVTALYLDKTEPQESGKLFFRYDTVDERGFRRAYQVKDGEDIPALLFNDVPFERVDFLLLNAYMCHHRTSRFVNNRVLNLMRESGSVAIDNDMLRIHENGVLTEIPLETKEDLKRALVEHFGMPEREVQAL